MASDDNESGDDSKPADRPSPAPLPPDVERALAKARAAADRPRGGPGAGTKDARWLALIPLIAALLTALLMMPRAAPPDEVPLPEVDRKALEATRKDDADRAASARATRLSGAALLVGTQLRALNKAQVKHASLEDVGAARAGLDATLRALLGEENAPDALRTLRAVQLETFLAEVERYETTGEATAELDEIAGGFVERMSLAGWIQGRTVLLDDAQRRAAYKLVWTATVGADNVPGLALGLDEQRVLYTLYLTRPHAAEAERLWLETMRRAATTDDACAKAVRQEKVAMDQWRVEKIKRLGEIDPTYPTGYALGVAHYRAGHYDLSLQAFRGWTARHPDGPLALRARNHMKAALAMYNGGAI